MTDEGIALGCLGAWFALMAAGAIGWVLNVIKIFAALSEPLTGLFIARCISVVIFPIGCIAGWL